MKQTPILENVYGRIDVVELDKSSGAFIRVASVFMLGDASKYVTDLKSFNTKNKKLVEAIGINILPSTPVRANTGKKTMTIMNWPNPAAERISTVAS